MRKRRAEPFHSLARSGLYGVRGKRLIFHREEYNGLGLRARYHGPEIQRYVAERTAGRCERWRPWTRTSVTGGLPVPQVLSTLSVLEMRHLIRRLSGTTVVRL